MPGVPSRVSAVRTLGPLRVMRNLIQIARYEARRLEPPARASAATITFYSHKRSARTPKP